MRTPTRLSSSRLSTPRQPVQSSPSTPSEKDEEDIPIDSALLEEDEDEEDDLADAEGEIIDVDVELVTVQGPSDAPQAEHHDRMQSLSPPLPSRHDSLPHLRKQPCASSSRDLDEDSVTSSSITPAPPKKSGRLVKTRTPAFETPHIPNGRHKSNGYGKGKGKDSTSLTPYPLSTPMYAAVSAGSQSSAHVRASREDNCSFCGGSDERNRQGFQEAMVSCGRCGRSGHPSCLNMGNKELRHNIMTYDWCCVECKTCEVCMIKGDDHRLMFCDGCDRGWHSYCLNPPLAKPPKGLWHCVKCRNPQPTIPLPHIPAVKSGLSFPASSSRKGKGRASELAHSFSTPTARGRKLGSRTDLFDNDNLHPVIKLKPRGKGKDKARTASSSPAVKVHLRIPRGGRRQTVEMESEEERIPYGGVINGQDADVSRTSITERDKEVFERARKAAESKLGGPAPPQWDPHTAIPVSPAPSSHDHSSFTPIRSTPIPASRSMRDRLLQQSVSYDISSFAFPAAGSNTNASSAASTSQKIKTIRFGVFDIDTWYSAPYPEEYQHVPDGRLWLCEFCLKYMKSGFVAGRHRMKCKARHPPGDEIYRDGSVSVFEVDGRKNKIYCQNLCLLAKMFLDHKTLYYDVEPFLFYVITEVDDLGARFVGYFSKEKRSLDNNVSCIMTLPVRQRKGWGQLLIDFSYLLSKKEGRVGSPEKPLSGLGEVTYRKYWTLAVFDYLRNAPNNVTMDDISAVTSMTLDDIFSVLKHQSMINIHTAPAPSYSTPQWRGRGRGRGRGRPSVHRRKADSVPAGVDDKSEIPSQYDIVFDREYVVAVLKKNESKGYLTLRPERLKYHPFLVTRNPVKPPGNIAKATLMSATVRVDHSTPSEVVETPNGNDGLEMDSEKVVLGEDPATLALVAALSASVSPKRSLRKRGSDEVIIEPLKRLRSAETPNGMGRRSASRGTITPNGSLTRRSLRNGFIAHETRGKVNGNGSGNGDIRGEDTEVDDPSETEEEEEEQIEEKVNGDAEWGLGEEDAEGEDDEEYVA